MPFVRRRETKAGGECTSLVESYRDAKGRPRQRILANLYGAPTPLEALAKLAAQRERLRKEKAELRPALEDAEESYRTLTTASMSGYKFSSAERRALDRLLPVRERLLKRAKTMDGTLARIAKDGAAIRRHCDAAPDEIQAAIRQYKKKLKDAETMLMGAEFYYQNAKQDLQRLSLPPHAEDAERSLFVRSMSRKSQ